jgi:hypothetical protein
MEPSADAVIPAAQPTSAEGASQSHERAAFAESATRAAAALRSLSRVRPLPAVSEGEAFALGTAASACVLATELVSSRFGAVDLTGALVALGLGSTVGALPAWATAGRRGRRVLSAWLLGVPLVLGGKAVIWALERAVELELGVVALAAPIAAFPVAIFVWRLAARLFGRSARFGAASQVALRFALAGTAYVFALLLAQALPFVAALLALVLVLGAGWLVLASGLTGPIGPCLLAAFIALELPRVDRTYFALRTIALGMAFGAAILGAREFMAGVRTSAPPRPPRPYVRRAALALGWLVLAVTSERLVSAHRHAFIERLEPTGALSATIEALQRVTDFDGDGHASIFGGRDCAPLDASRSPGAHEIPRNGRDDNCAGGDARGNPVEFLRGELAVNLPPPPLRRDAVLVIVDTMRADAVGPNLAAFAREGRRFTHAYSTASFTAQSLVGILTGSLPTAADYQFASPHDAKVMNLPPSVFAAARHAGYATGMAGGIRGVLFSAFFRDADVAKPLAMIARAEETTDTALEVWRQLDPQKPRLLYVHYVALHASRDLDDYRRNALEVDGELQRLFRALGDEPIWMITGDHGESFGEHGVFGHSTALYRNELAVPLVVRYPGVVRGEESAVTSLIGVAPTLMALMAPEELALPRGPYFCLGQTGCGDVPAASALEKPFTHIHSLVVGNHHALHGLLLDRSFEFDWAADPDELRPLAARGPANHELAEWEELGFVRGARVPWFKQR